MILLNLEPENFSLKAIETINQIAEYKTITSTERDEIFWKNVSIANIIWTRLGYKISNKFIKKAKNLKIIVTPTTGLNHIDLHTCRKENIDVISLKGETDFLKNITSTAELTFGLILELIRHIGESSRVLTYDHRFDRDRFRGYQLNGKSIGIIGMGRLGKIVSKIASGFGMKIYFYDIKDINQRIQYTRCKTIDELLTKSDFVTLHVDYKDSNAKIIGEKEFKNMKETAYFINTSRGELIDEIALLNALQSKEIAGAALDVLSDENDIVSHITNHPLIKYAQTNKNLIITPHIGGASFDAMQITEEYIAKKLVKKFLKIT